MPDLKDAYRLATDQVRPAPGALDRQRALQRRAGRRRKAGVFVAIAAVVTLIAAVAMGGQALRSDDDRSAYQPVPSTLYSLDVGSGELTPFQDPGDGTFDFELSPDGQRLLMSWDHMQTGKRQIWTANADGTDADVLIEHDAAFGTWFPDSRHIAYIGLPPDGDTRQVIVLDIETGETEVVTDEESDPNGVAVAPDGRTIVYTVNERLSSEPAVVSMDGPAATNFASPPRSWLKAADVETSQVRTLSRGNERHYWGPDVAPSGDVVWVVGRHGYLGYDDISQIRGISLDGTREHVIMDVADLSVPSVDCAAWSPDGSAVAYTRGSADRTYETWIYDPRSGEHRLVGPGCMQTWLDDHTVLVGT